MEQVRTPPKSEQIVIDARIEMPEGILPSEDLPDGWSLSTLGNVADVVGGGTPRSSEPENFSEDEHPWITPADLSGFSDLYIRRGRRDLSEKGLRSCSAVIMPAGTVLMSSRAPIGYVAIAENALCTNQGFKSFVCHSGIDPEFVYFWLRLITPQLEQMGSGSTFMEISGSRAKEIPMLLAPTVEQRRVATQIKRILPSLNCAHDHLSKVPAIVNNFRQAVLAAACSGRLTEDWREATNSFELPTHVLDRVHERRLKEYEQRCLLACKSGHRKPREPENLQPQLRESEHGQREIPDSWMWLSLRDVAASHQYAMSSGPFGSALGTKDYRSSGIPVIRGQNIQAGRFVLGNLVFVSEDKANELARSTAYPDDIVVVAVGTSGQAAVVPEAISRAVLSQMGIPVKANAHSGGKPNGIPVMVNSSQSAATLTC